MGTPLRLGTYSPDVPAHAQIDLLQFSTVSFPLGLREPRRTTLPAHLSE